MVILALMIYIVVVLVIALMPHKYLTITSIETSLIQRL